MPHHVHIGSGTHAVSYEIGKGSLSRMYSGQLLNRTILLYLVPKLRVHGAVPSLPVTSLFREAQRRHLYCFHVELLANF